MSDVHLERFRDGYRHDLGRALGELEQGRKRSHWMWFMFPQVAGLGTSPMAAHYAIHSRGEAKAFLRDPDLGPGYQELVDAVWRQIIGRGATIQMLFGQPDDQKLVSSLTLFAGVAAELGDEWTLGLIKANEILDRAAEQGLPRCAATQRFLVGDTCPRDRSDGRPDR
jgi:uncharacterized protein (DUF1810 family)